MSVNEKITVVKGKKEIVVLEFGQHPVYDAGKGRIIPSNFQAETYVSGYTFIASTLVDSKEDKVKYRFALRDDPEICSGWKKSPTGALDEVNRMLKNHRHKEGTNGQLMIGVTYEPVQERLRQIFNAAPPSLPASRKRTRNSAAAAAAVSAPPPIVRGGKPMLRTSVKQEELHDEKSMQPVVYSDLTLTKRQRGDSQLDEEICSSQISLDIAARYVEKMCSNSQESLFAEDSAGKWLSAYGGGNSQESFTVTMQGKAVREDSLLSFRRDCSLLNSLGRSLREDSLLSFPTTTFKFGRSETQTSVLGDESNWGISKDSSANKQ